jgi:hypothetical protein
MTLRRTCGARCAAVGKVPIDHLYGTSIVSRPRDRHGLELHLMTPKKGKRIEQKVLIASTRLSPSCGRP